MPSSKLWMQWVTHIPTRNGCECTRQHGMHGVGRVGAVWGVQLPKVWGLCQQTPWGVGRFLDSQGAVHGAAANRCIHMMRNMMMMMT